MDCKTARLLLEFARPQQRELDALEGDALEAHLAACPDCARTSQHERNLDDRMRQAMRAVVVPEQLRSRVLSRLSADRSAAASRRWRIRCAFAAAAALLLLVAGSLLYTQVRPRPFDVDRVTHDVIEDAIRGNDPERVQAAYRRQGVHMVAPTAFNYNYLAHHGMAELQEQQVPCLVFIRNDEAASIHAHAKVYVVSERQFVLKDVPTNYQSPTGYTYQVEVIREPGSRYAYVVVYTGENLGWLKRNVETE